ncbi:pif1, partial [Symbiodinium sp. CCMP2456]
MFCDNVRLEAALARPGSDLARVLADYLKANEDVFERALAAIGEISPDVAYYEAAARGQEWPQVLLHRKRLRADPTPAESRLYADRVNNDRRRVQNKFFPAKARKIQHSGHQWENPLSQELQSKIADTAANDSGLPAAHLGLDTGYLEKWCKEGSWSLHRDVVLALRPLEIDCGPYQRGEYGYRVHTSLVRFSWCLLAVDAKIQALPSAHKRKQARNAKNYLMQCATSEYRTFLARQEAFLSNHPDATENEAKLPLNFLEEPGVECAIWPDLYFHSDICETVERATDVRRLMRSHGDLAPGAVADDEEEESDEATAAGGRHSVRRSFLRKILGPITDYAGEYELLHFVFDLCLWTDIGSKRHALTHLSMRVALKAQPWTPAYWAVRHAALVDLQRQCGPPVLFKTWAPYEWAAPYHRWILHAMELEQRSRLHLAGPETLHLAHIMTELFREWVHGGAFKQGPGSSRWIRPALCHRDPSLPSPVLNFACRLEFQDGKRKLASQSYHGRETAHLHGLTFAHSLVELPLERRLMATVPAAGHALRGYVLDGQAGRTGSGWPVHEGESGFSDDGYLRLRHTEADKDMGIRAYDVEELDVLKFHQDNVVPNEAINGHGLLLRYIATYLSKFSSSSFHELLDDTGSTGCGLAVRILATYHPGEPEMWLALAAQQFPQFAVGGTVRPIQAPWPGMPEKPDFVLNYERCAWRGEDMCLLDWLRKTNTKGDIVSWVKQAHRHSQETVSLEEYSRSCECKGEKILVPAQYALHACALQHAPAHWTDERRLETAVNDRVNRAVRIGQAATEEQADMLAREAAAHNSILVCTGPPGCGKTLVADQCLEHAKCVGARIVYALPTGQLAARVRQKHPTIHVDTCHGAFLFHRPLCEALPILSAYDLVIVDEALQLSTEHFGRLREMWLAAGRLPALLLLGDPWQLPNIDGEPADAHPSWRLNVCMTLHAVHRCKDETLARKLHTLRMSKFEGEAGLR